MEESNISDEELDGFSRLKVISFECLGDLQTIPTRMIWNTRDSLSDLKCQIRSTLNMDLRKGETEDSVYLHRVKLDDDGGYCVKEMITDKKAVMDKDTLCIEIPSMNVTPAVRRKAVHCHYKRSAPSSNGTQQAKKKRKSPKLAPTKKRK